MSNHEEQSQAKESVPHTTIHLSLNVVHRTPPYDLTTERPGLSELEVVYISNTGRTEHLHSSTPSIEASPVTDHEKYNDEQAIAVCRSLATLFAHGVTEKGDCLSWMAISEGSGPASTAWAQVYPELAGLVDGSGVDNKQMLSALESLAKEHLTEVEKGNLAKWFSQPSTWSLSINVDSHGPQDASDVDKTGLMAAIYRALDIGPPLRDVVESTTVEVLPDPIHKRRAVCRVLEGPKRD